ncbi:MAG: HRDC domain-containing protein, partial [Planctomycetes bacterium]|nr:HRDC domain-containing protein [Planctomycetota bacterium]
DRTVSVLPQLATTGDRVLWCVAVEYLEVGVARSGGAAYAHGDRRNRIDYREILRPAEFVVFSRLRELRKQFAESERVPVYAVFNNEQLATIAQQRPGRLGWAAGLIFVAAALSMLPEHPEDVMFGWTGGRG